MCFEVVFKRKKLLNGNLISVITVQSYLERCLQAFRSSVVYFFETMTQHVISCNLFSDDSFILSSKIITSLNNNFEKKLAFITSLEYVLTENILVYSYFLCISTILSHRWK